MSVTATEPVATEQATSWWGRDSSEPVKRNLGLVGVLLATLTGTFIGLARLSKNFLLRTLCAAYIEFIRNVPLLVQLFFWYAVITEGLPGPREALSPLPGVFLFWYMIRTGLADQVADQAAVQR